MNFILRLKHWQAFIIVIMGLFISNFTVVGDPVLTITLRVIGTVIFFAWGLFAGHGLYQLLPGKIDLNYNLFLINSFIWLASYIVVIVISDGAGMTFNGVAALPGFYVCYAFLHFLIFPVRTLRSIEKNRKARISECMGDFCMVVFLPIGIWFLQPRINKVSQKNEVIS